MQIKNLHLRISEAILLMVLTKEQNNLQPCQSIEVYHSDELCVVRGQPAPDGSDKLSTRQGIGLLNFLTVLFLLCFVSLQNLRKVWNDDPKI